MWHCTITEIKLTMIPLLLTFENLMPARSVFLSSNCFYAPPGAWLRFVIKFCDTRGHTDWGALWDQSILATV